MQTIIYDGSFNGWLSVVFDCYDYKFNDVQICTRERFNGNIFERVHTTLTNEEHSERVLKGLRKKVSDEAIKQVYQTFLSEIAGIEDVLLRYVQYAFSGSLPIEQDFSNDDVLTVVQTAKKVWREKHRMEAFVRFQKTGDGLFYAIIDPDYNVLPLIAKHFTKRYADQRWMIYDSKRKYGIFYDGHSCSEISVEFSVGLDSGENITTHYDEDETIYQELWKRYFASVNIAARKNTKLHLQHMPRRYWKYLVEKQV